MGNSAARPAGDDRAAFPPLPAATWNRADDVLRALEARGATTCEGLYRVSGLRTDVVRGGTWIAMGSSGASGGGDGGDSAGGRRSSAAGAGEPTGGGGGDRALEYGDLRGIHEWAGALRHALRQFEPLTTYALYDALLRCDDVPDVAAVLALLPPANYARLRAVCRHLLRVADAADVTRMTRSNLAKLWGSVLARHDEVATRDLRTELRVATEQHRIAAALLDFFASAASDAQPPRPRRVEHVAVPPGAGPRGGASGAPAFSRARQLSADETWGDRARGVGGAPGHRSLSTDDLSTGSRVGGASGAAAARHIAAGRGGAVSASARHIGRSGGAGAPPARDDADHSRSFPRARGAGAGLGGDGGFGGAGYFAAPGPAAYVHAGRSASMGGVGVGGAPGGGGPLWDLDTVEEDFATGAHARKSSSAVRFDAAALLALLAERDAGGAAAPQDAARRASGSSSSNGAPSVPSRPTSDRGAAAALLHLPPHGGGRARDGARGDA